MSLRDYLNYVAVREGAVRDPHWTPGAGDTVDFKPVPMTEVSETVLTDVEYETFLRSLALREQGR